MISSSPISSYFIGIIDDNSCIQPTFFGPSLTVSADAEIFSKPEVKYVLCTAVNNRGKYNQYTEEDVKVDLFGKYSFSSNMLPHILAVQNKFPYHGVVCQRLFRNKHTPGSSYTFIMPLIGHQK